MLRCDAPLLINPVPDWHKISWMAEFLWNIRHYEANTVDTVKLAIAARRELFEMAEREKINFDHERRGILHVYRNKKDFKHACHVNRLLSRGGLDRQAVTAEEIVDIEPAIRESFYAGFYTPSDSTGDIHKFTRGLAQACQKSGVVFHCDTIVNQIGTEGEKPWLKLSNADGVGRNFECVEADGIVICAGVGSRALARVLGDRLSVYPVKGYSITINVTSAAAPWVSLLDDHAKIVASRLGSDRFRVAGTAEFNGFNRDIRADRIAPLVTWTRWLFPALDTDQVVPWCGLRPMLPNMVPVVRPSKRRRVYYNTGHGHLGWTLAAITARMTANLLVKDIAP